MQKSNQTYLPLIGSLYINYLFQGIAAIAISQNLALFQKQWSASLSQVTLVISAIGLGRIISLNFSGWFSDRFSRKQTVLIGVIAYCLFFFGIVWTNHYLPAFLVALLAGVGNAFLDTSTYPIVVESFPSENDNSALSVLNKAFISIGQFIFPFITRWTIQQHLYFGWTFLMCALGLLLNLFFLRRFAYPDRQDLAEKKPIRSQLPRAKIGAEGAALMLFSFVSVSLFNVFILWIPSFSEQVLSIKNEDSLLFVSIYSIASFVSVFLTSFIVKRKANIAKLILICLLATALSLGGMLLFPSLQSIVLASLTVGVFAAGGIWQLGLALLLEFFPQSKGMVTSFYSLTTAISVMVTPYLTGLMAERSIYQVFAYDFFLALVGFLAILLVKYRYEKVFSKENVTI
ncbi:MFS transporter [Streptococcus panodentis]|uniref:MFS transporter n=1 Tax=Streptococcus panodentis TaxID=1581472 RepID=A0ABS5AYD4_9STRE|nr:MULTISPECIES: MFS transporter [Streptococcus]KXT79559.1 putative transport system permease protein [Streptococcus sp. DD11]MBP2621441.1 MFS transporter [Streptococcus panodentis]